MGVLSLYIHYFKVITTSYNYMTSCIGVLITFSKYDCIIVHKAYYLFTCTCVSINSFHSHNHSHGHVDLMHGILKHIVNCQ